MEVLDPIEARAIWSQDLEKHSSRTTDLDLSFGEFSCLLCKDLFGTQQFMLEHLYFEHFFGRSKMELLYQDLHGTCKVCKTPLEGPLDEHVAEHHILWTRCPVCEKDYADRTEMMDHLLVHIDEKTCSVDPEPDNETVVETYKSNPKDKSFQCPMCTKEYSGRHDLAYHVWKKHFFDMENAIKTYQGKTFRMCRVCNGYTPNLVSHILKKHVPATCPVCQQDFDKLCKMRNHLLDEHTVTGMTPTSCPICNVQFNVRFDFLFHLYWSHFEDENIVANYRDYTANPDWCKVCDKYFESFTLHVHVKHIEPICPVCHKKCDQMIDMQLHLLKEHTGNTQYVSDSPAPNTSAANLRPASLATACIKMSKEKQTPEPVTCPMTSKCNRSFGNRFKPLTAMLFHLTWDHFVDQSVLDEFRDPEKGDKHCTKCNLNIVSSFPLHVFHKHRQRECPVCLEKLNKPVDVLYHVYNEHTDAGQSQKLSQDNLDWQNMLVEVRKCPSCSKSFKSAYGMLNHLHYQHFVLPLFDELPNVENDLCTICKRYCKRQDLATHIIRKHARLKYDECPVCYARCSYTLSMLRHLHLDHAIKSDA